MKNPIAIDQFKTWLSIGILALFALAIVWFAQVLRKNGDDVLQSSKNRTDPDYFVEGLNFLRLSNQGNANYHVTGQLLEHYPKTDHFEIQNVNISSFSESRDPLLLKAKRVIVEPKNSLVITNRKEDKIHLHDSVEMFSKERGTGQITRVVTQYLLMLPNQESITTDSPIEFYGKNFQATAVGMESTHHGEQIKLLSQIKIRIQKQQKNQQLNQELNDAPSFPSNLNLLK